MNPLVNRNMDQPSVPVGDSEIIQRAVTRARLALKAQKADIGVGFSDGVCENDTGFFTAAWCAVITRNGDCHLGGGLHIQLPDYLLNQMKAGSLLERDIEEYLQETIENPFEKLVEYAVAGLRS